jgi:hypothetical protein
VSDAATNRPAANGASTNGSTNGTSSTSISTRGHAVATTPPSLDTAVRRRRTDQAFFLRLGRAIAQNERVIQRLSR